MSDVKDKTTEGSGDSALPKEKAAVSDPADKSNNSSEVEDELEGNDSTHESEFERAKFAIVDAAKLAKETKDYLSYATVLDVHLSKPEIYSSAEKVELLTTLKTVLKENDELVYQIGWDLPQLLLPYTISYNYDFIHRVSRANAPFVFEVAGIFILLANKGNAKEVFLKTAEIIYELRIEELDEYSTSDDGGEGDDSVSIKEADDKLLAEVTEDDGHTDSVCETAPVAAHSLTVREQYFDLRFSLYFELLKSCLIRIKVKYPSRFVATASTVLLACAASNLKDFTIRSNLVFMRRLFLFARDFDLSDLSEAKESESEIVRKLLQGFVTWTVRLGLDRFSVKWSHRLFYETKAGLAHDPNPEIRVQACDLSLNSRRLNQALGRLSMIAYTFDLDLFTELRRIARADVINALDTEPSDDATVNKNFTNLSDDGLVLLATQAKCDHRDYDTELTFGELVELTIKLLDRGEGDIAPLGIQDAVCFWGQWVTEKVTSEEVQKVPKLRFFAYLQQLMIISGLSDDSVTRYLINTLIAKLLRLSTPEVAFEYLVDTLSYCPFKSCQDAAIRMLKMFTLKQAPAKSISADPTNADPKVKELADQVKSLEISGKTPFIELDKSKIATVQDQIQRSLDEVKGSGGLFSEALPVLLSWLNFAVVADLSQSFVTTLLRQTKEFESEHQTISNTDLIQELNKRKTLLELARASVEKAHLNNTKV